MPLDGRREALQQFSRDEASPSGGPLLVCTDLAARCPIVVGDLPLSSLAIQYFISLSAFCMFLLGLGMLESRVLVAAI